MINHLLRSACDSLGFNFIDNSSIACNHLARDGIHYAGTEVLLGSIAFCLSISYEIWQAKIMNHLIYIFQ